MKTTDKREREKHVVHLMIALYCRKKHGRRTLCPSCAALDQYAAARSVTGLENAVLQLLCAAVLTIFVGFRGGLSFRLAVSDVFPVLLLCLVNTGIGCGSYFSSIGSLPAQTVAVCGYLEPLFAVLLSMLILHETTSSLQTIGAILIVGGAIFEECFRKKRIA